MKRIVSIFLGIIMAITLLIGSLVFLCQFEYFYEKEFEKLGVIDEAGIEVEAAEVANVMVEYLEGDLPEFQIRAKVKGVEQDLFKEKEQTHMRDIIKLIKIGNSVTLIGVIIIVIVYGLCILKKEREILKKGYKTALFTYILLLLGLSLIAIVDFDEAFTIFHEFVFKNDLWLLDPSQDILIMLMPLEFFIDALKFILTMATSSILIIGVITWHILRKINTFTL